MEDESDIWNALHLIAELLEASEKRQIAFQAKILKLAETFDEALSDLANELREVTRHLEQIAGNTAALIPPSIEDDDGPSVD